MARKKGFIVHENAYEQVGLLGDAECGRVFRSLFEYHREGKQPEGFTPLMQAVFIGLRQAMDMDAEAYQERCEQNRINGQKGGRPRKDAPEKTEEKPKKPKKADMDMDMGIEIDMDIDIDVDMDMEVGMDMESKQTESIFSSADRSALSEKAIKVLQSLGLSIDYIEERQERILAYCEIHKKNPMETFLRWWKQDERNKERKARKAAREATQVENKSYDLEEFCEAAIARGLREAKEIEASRRNAEDLGCDFTLQRC